MSSLIGAAAQAEFTGQLIDHFDTFKKPLIVFKEPIQTVNTDANVYVGYNEIQGETVTYAPVSGAFYALKVANNKVAVNYVPRTDNVVYSSIIRIKVLPETHKFISEGKTESVLFNDMTYNVISSPIPKDIFGLRFYYYDLAQSF
jgi:hypothetical protein